MKVTCIRIIVIFQIEIASPSSSKTLATAKLKIMIVLLFLATFVSFWGRTFAVPPITPKADEFLRIAQYDHSLDVQLDNNNRQINVQIDSGDSNLIGSHNNRAIRGLEGFDSVNVFLSGVELELPDQTVEKDLLLKTLILNLKNLRCTDINIGNIVVTPEPGSTSTTLSVVVDNLDMTCFLEYDYSLGFGKPGEGSGSGRAEDNRLSVDIILSHLEDGPPSFAESQNCESEINIENLQLVGDTPLSTIININAFQSLIGTAIAGIVERKVCDAVEDFTSTSITNFLEGFNDMINPYLDTYGGMDDPLAAEDTLVIPEDISIVNFQNTDESEIAKGLGSILNIINDLLNQTVDDPSGDDLYINTFLRDSILDEDRTLSLTISDFASGGLPLWEGGDGSFIQASITLESIQFLGLDTFKEFKPPDAIGMYTLQTLLAWESLDVELVARLELISETGSTLTETATVGLKVNDFVIDIAILVAIDESKFGNFYLGPLLHTGNLLPCVLSTMLDLEIAHLSIEFGDIERPAVGGFVSQGLNELVSTLVETMYAFYEETVIKALPNFFRSEFKDFVNDEFQRILEDQPCPNPLIPSESSNLDLRDLFLKQNDAAARGGTGTSPYGNVMPIVRNLLITKGFAINEDTGLIDTLNDVIEPVTEEQSGVAGMMTYDGNLVDLNTNVTIGRFFTDIMFQVSNAFIENLNSVGGPIDLINPLSNSANIVNNTASLGAGKKSIRFGATLLLALSGDDDLQVWNEVSITLALDDMRTYFDILLLIDEESLVTFPLENILNPYCWLATLPPPLLDSRGIRVEESQPSVDIVNLILSVAKLDLNVTCKNCTSEGLAKLDEQLNSPDAIEQARTAANDILGYITQLIEGEFLQTQADRFINEATKRCPHHHNYAINATNAKYDPLLDSSGRDETVSFLIAVAVSILCIIFTFVVVGFVVQRYVRQRNQVWLRSLPSARILHIATQQNRDNEKQQELDKDSMALFQSPEVPVVARAAVPIVLLVNICLFLSGHLSLGGSVNLVVGIAEETIDISNVFQFNVAKTIIDLWNAGGEELAILIFLFSGIWPYTKQIITLALWFLPPCRVSTSRRGSILAWLEALAKWSIVDIFVLIMAMVAFRISLVSPDRLFLPEDFYSVEVMVEPLWGIYANMIAQLLSQISSHFIIYYHRRTVKASYRAYNQKRCGATNTDQNTGFGGNSIEVQSKRDRLILHDHAFSRPHRGEYDKLRVRQGANAGLAVSAFVLVLVVLLGSSLTSLSVEFLGLIGIAIEAGRDFEQAKDDYSLFSIVQLLMDNASFLGTAKAYIGHFSLSALMIVSVLIVPVVQSIGLLVQWFAPMDDKIRSRRLFFVEILQAWQYLDVFVVSIFISSWQLGSASQFMVNQYCESLNTTFATLEFYGILDEDDAQCFKVQPTIEIGWYLLLLGAFTLWLLTKFVQDAVVQYRRDKSVLPSDSIGGRDSRSVTNETVVTMIDDIQPVPVLFTDSLRWIMIRQDANGYDSKNKATRDQDMKRQPSYDGGDPKIIVPIPPPVESEIAQNMAEVQHCERVESFGLAEVNMPSHNEASPAMKIGHQVGHQERKEKSHNAVSSSPRLTPSNCGHGRPEAARDGNVQMMMPSKKRGSFGLSPMPPIRNSEQQAMKTSKNRGGVHRTDAKSLRQNSEGLRPYRSNR